MSLESNTRSENQKPLHEPAWIDLVRRQVSSLKYGVVQITVHDSRVVQIEHTEKVRLDHPGEKV